MMDKVENITPDYHPVALLKGCSEKVKQARAAAVIWVDKEGHVHWDQCAITKQELLWALENMKMEVIDNDS